MTLTIELPDKLVEALDAKARFAGQTSDAIIADAVRAHLAGDDCASSTVSSGSLLDRLSPVLEKATTLQILPVAEGELPWSLREGLD